MPRFWNSVAKRLLASAGWELRRFRPGHEGRRRYSNFGEQEILRHLVSILSPNLHQVVDIGAGDGFLHSNSLGLFDLGWGGAAIEADGELFGKLAWRHRAADRIALAHVRVTPKNVVPLLQGLKLPREFGVLSLDIDGYDYFVLEAVLGAFSPSILCVEINEKIPPPLRFTVLWREDYVWKGDHFYGQSLAQAHALAAEHGYVLAGLEYNNAFFLRREFHPETGLTPEAAYRQGYLDRGDRLQKLPWNRDMEEVQGLPAAAAAEKLRARFAPYAGRYSLEY